ncbi:hypothetical protein [Staphylococcus aureus]|uniref:glycosyl-4,4'-diaponeurosporenoate acyltransferase CrtO family protein n=1 Tax=Staphylococcus aureus TaxID=1280 RepID=UPI002163ACA0|nr:hypothetical protein [Staphylococcus aureus]
MKLRRKRRRLNLKQRRKRSLKKISKRISRRRIVKRILKRQRRVIALISILPVIIFIKGPRLVKYINVFYAMIANVPIIIVQRYNRPRLTQLLRILKRRGERHD